MILAFSAFTPTHMQSGYAQENPIEEEYFEEEFFEFWDTAFDDPSDESVIDGLDDINIEIDLLGTETAFREWLVVVPEDQLSALSDVGIVTTDSTRLAALGLTIIRLTTLGNASLEETQRAIQAVAPDAEIDVNDLYGRATPPDNASEQIWAPHEILTFSASLKGDDITIGVIDTDVNTQHEVIRGANITTRGFATQGKSEPTAHGTAIVSLLAGRAEGYRGLLPSAHYYCASVFSETADGGQVAKTDAIAEAMNWMATEDVKIVNMSLAGPENRVLKRVVAAFLDKNASIIAAVGNEGPASKPLYPAAYDGVIGVTAIDANKAVYRLAVRGNHVDLAAPGIDVRHALASGGYEVSSGTSMAAPFVTAAIAIESAIRNTPPQSASRILVQNAEDLGEPGRDLIYGAGLVRLSAVANGS